MPQQQNESRIIEKSSHAHQLNAHPAPTTNTQRQVNDSTDFFFNSRAVRKLCESLAEGLIVIGDSGDIYLINRRIQELFGYGPEELVGRSLDTLIPDRFVKTHAQHVAGFKARPRARPMGQGLDLTGKHKDGTELPVEISLSYLQTDAGLITMALITDISQRKRFEKELQERNEALDAFAHTVAHDLKTPLALIVGFSEILLDMYHQLPPQELQRYLLSIAENSRKMSSIINELLLLASIRKEDVVLSPLDMASIVEEALKRLQFQIQELGAEILVPDDYDIALGYAPWVEEVWFNYVNNALKYGGEPPIVELGSTIQDESFVRFWVKDNGPGLTAQQQTELFTPFTRLEQPRIEGHGLGLSIVRRIVEKLNGHVSIDSKPGEGCTFSFTLARIE